MRSEATVNLVQSDVCDTPSLTTIRSFCCRLEVIDTHQGHRHLHSRHAACVCGGETSVQLPPIVGSRPSFVPLSMPIWGQWRRQVLESLSTKEPLEGWKGEGLTGTGGGKVPSVPQVLFSIYLLIFFGSQTICILYQVSKTLGVKTFLSFSMIFDRGLPHVPTRPLPFCVSHLD